MTKAIVLNSCTNIPEVKTVRLRRISIYQQFSLIPKHLQIIKQKPMVSQVLHHDNNRFLMHMFAKISISKC